MNVRVSATLLAVTLFTACDAPTEPTGALPSWDPNGLLMESAVAASASGAAHRESEGLPVLLNFSAAQHADGRVTGSYYYRAVSTGTWISVDVTCLTVVENRAWVAGIITDSSIGRLVGTVSYFYTRDNGEGVDATDEVSLVRAGDPVGEDGLFCTELPTVLANREVLHGNVEVR